MNLVLYLAVIATVIYQASAIALDVGDQNSVKQAATTLAQTFYEYHNPSATTGQFDQPEPWFWWLSGAGWTALID
ncbi:hypothetical protein KC318_g18049, partial [Hortaea werneckii]